MTDQTSSQHPDDAAVDALAALMKAKLAKQRAKGYGGWNDKTQCSQQRLSDMLRAHVDKGDPVDVANFCAMLSARGEGIAAVLHPMPAVTKEGKSYEQNFSAQPVILPDGWKLIAVNPEFDNLMYWLNRCEDKGHLEQCSDLIEPWLVFDYDSKTDFSCIAKSNAETSNHQPT